jgi:hypothetical protein
VPLPYYSFLQANLDVEARNPIVAAGWKQTAPIPSQYLTLQKSQNEMVNVILPSHYRFIFSGQVISLINSGNVAANLVYLGLWGSSQCL